MISIRTKFLLGLGIFVFLYSGFVFVRTWFVISEQTEEMSSSQGKLALQFELAIRHHIGEGDRHTSQGSNKGINSSLDPMSAYFVSQNVLADIRKQFPDYVFKICSDNPVNPENKAEPEEMQLIKYFRENPKATKWSGRMQMNGKKYIVYCMPRRMEESCLKCHEQLKDESEFSLAGSSKKEKDQSLAGQTLGLDIVGVPLDKLYAKILSDAFTQLVIMAIGLVFLFGGVLFVFRWVIGKRLAVITEHFKEAASQDKDTYISPIIIQGNDEIGVLATSYNSLVIRMQSLYESLEQKVEERTTKLQKEIAERKLIQEELMQAKLTAEAASKSKSEFLANVSHEIRTPMTAIMGYFDLLMENIPYNPETADAAVTIKRNCEHLLKIINDILDVSKIEAGKLEIEHTLCSPCNIVAEIASTMRIRAMAKGIPLEVEYQGFIPETIYTDPSRLRQILINLVGNAVKFTNTGSIRIVTKFLANESKLQIQVIDSGIGMSGELLEKLFTPFTQADTSMKRQFDGTGLGLTISKRLLYLLGGEITVESNVGTGSTFTITVPTGPLGGVKLLESPNEILGVYQEEKMLAANQAMQLPKGCRILLAEDGPENQRLIALILKKAGADVTVVANGQLAVESALASREAGEPYDVILMDMQMPILDGYNATKKLRSKKWSRPIIALTAHAMSEDRVKCLDAGCNEYLSKPIDRHKLLQMLDQFVDKAVREHSKAAKFD